MNKKTIMNQLFALVFLFFSGISAGYAQLERTAGKIVNDGSPGGIVETWSLETTKEVEGTFFMNENWYVGSIQLYDGRILENVPLKYNLRDDVLNILDKNGDVRVLRSDKVKTFNWYNQDNNENEQYVNCMDYPINNTKLTGVAEVLVEGNCDLLRYNHLILQKGTYSVVHDAGQKYDEYIIEEEFYVNKDDELHKVKNKRTVLSVFEEESDKLKEYIKANKLNVKKEEGLTRLIDYYNSL